MPMRLHVRVFMLVAMVALLFAQPAGAIQYGVPDDGAHPYVGGLVFEVDGQQFVGCSGTLIAPTTVLTAAHCAPDDTFQLIGVTFDDTFVPGESTVVLATEFVANPDYDGSAYTDVAVVLLESDPGVGYAVLPEIGLLDSLAPSAEPGNQARSLTAVGYGTTGLNRGEGGPPRFVYPDVRMRAENQIINLNNKRLGGLLVQTTAAPGTGGGTCYGDSGGPFFVAGTNILVATTITGTNRNCGGADINLRIDTEAVQDFLADYI
ncbi:MAG: hypothetical protein AVDCRST_MAG26-4591 [uncultured Chloroflexia bacterium]|uniref:Peptidase S1 domain-containing protein n=1 Tax=uncultured Chloroflexia bacterium TaxID=1672391 RepID=A0A6J4K8R4_9CHLR|nr:MAG: hypothetical protein AVDCRST_MAG26-4591 [uncultured Chloroflexia bacterium]